jgi:hypothetical protein
MDTSIFTALWQQVANSPASLLLILGLSVIAYLLEIWPNFNSRYVPIVCILLGAVAYPFFSSRASVPPSYPYPLAVLIVNGLVVGFVAAIAHSQITLRAIGRLSPPSNPNPNPGSDAGKPS